MAAAILHYTRLGYAVLIPVSDVSRYDLVIDVDGVLERVEVKSTSSKNHEFSLRTSGGNQSWSGEVKRISCADCDRVFLYNLTTGSSKDFHSSELEGRRSINFS